MTTNQCPACAVGSIRVYSTRVNHELQSRIRYRRCTHCGFKPPNPQMIPLTVAPMQTNRRKEKQE